MVSEHWKKKKVTGFLDARIWVELTVKCSFLEYILNLRFACDRYRPLFPSFHLHLYCLVVFIRDRDHVQSWSRSSFPHPGEHHSCCRSFLEVRNSKWCLRSTILPYWDHRAPRHLHIWIRGRVHQDRIGGFEDIGFRRTFGLRSFRHCVVCNK